MKIRMESCVLAYLLTKTAAHAPCLKTGGGKRQQNKQNVKTIMRVA